MRWYDFVNNREVRALAEDREAKNLLTEIRFFGLFEKYFTDLFVLVARVTTLRTVRYPD